MFILSTSLDVAGIANKRTITELAGAKTEKNNQQVLEAGFVLSYSVHAGGTFCYPEKLLIAPFWDNPNILRNNKPIKPSAFPNLSSKVKTQKVTRHFGNFFFLCVYKQR